MPSERGTVRSENLIRNRSVITLVCSCSVFASKSPVMLRLRLHRPFSSLMASQGTPDEMCASSPTVILIDVRLGT